MDPTTASPVVINLPQATFWTSAAGGALISAIATLGAVFLTHITQNWRSSSELKEKRVLARDEALRQWRSNEVKVFVDRAAGRVTEYSTMIDRMRAAGGDLAVVEFRKSVDRLANEVEVLSEYAPPPGDAELAEAVAAFFRAEDNMVTALNTLCEAIERVERAPGQGKSEDEIKQAVAAAQEVSDGIDRRRLNKGLRNAIQTLNAAARQYVFRLDD